MQVEIFAIQTSDHILTGTSERIDTDTKAKAKAKEKSQLSSEI